VTAVIRVPRPASLPPADARLVVVEASAGTGKTYFLEHRVVDLVLAGADLGQILLVTFTDKAVAELRLRIRDLLDRLARAEVDAPAESHWTIDDAARRRLRAAVTAFDHAPIFTIHGFCHRILVEDAFAARRLFEQTQIADEVAFDNAFTALLRERFARSAPDRELLAAFLETDRTVDKLRSILLGCVRAGHDARVQRRLDPDAIHDALATLRAQLGGEDRRGQVFRTLAQNGTDRRYMPAWLDKVGAVLDRLPDILPPARALAAIDAMREPMGKLLDRAASSITHVPLEAALRGALGTVSLDEAIASEFLPRILDRIRDDKSERGHFDYDDMLNLVWRALKGPRAEELAQRLRERTPWAMIDEFQDTDPVQWNIFRQVWMTAEAKGLTIVGDPKQAIYGFRGADVDTYIAARDEMLRAGATRVPLDVNRRSTEPLVTAVNQILIGNFGMPLLDGAITYDEPVRASGDVTCDALRPPVTAFVVQAGKSQTEAIRVALGRAIGDEIEKLRAAPPAWTCRGSAPPFALGQVMVLTRTNKDSVEIAAALRSRGLPCALVEPDRLFRTREASELADVLATVAAPRDRSARLRALRTRFFDVPWAELAQVVDAPDHHASIARIFDWAQLASRRAYETLFRRIVEDSCYAERALVLGGGERALTNTWHLIELLLAEVARSRCDLHELVVQLRRWIADDTTHPDERDVQRAETDADAIRVLTIHKAKGLEAPYVFVFGGMSGGPKSDVHTLRDAVGRVLVVGNHDPAIKERLEADAGAEHQRLAYVALTRAQVRLYLPLYGEGALAKTAAYQPIQRCLAPLVARATTAPQLLFEQIPVAVGAAEPPFAPADALAGFTAPPPPPARELAPLGDGRTGLAMLSYTRLAHDVEAVRSVVATRALDPAEFDVDGDVAARPVSFVAPGGATGGDSTQLVLAELGPNDLPPGASSGLLLHDVLEVADLATAKSAADLAAWSSDSVVAKQLADAARARGIAATYLPHAASLVYQTLVQPIELTDGHTLPSLVDAQALAREVEFGYPLPGPDPQARRGLVKGYIDALVAWNDELWVVDYKSDLLANTQDRVAAAQDRVREHYTIQARLYALAADRIRGTRRLAGLMFAFVRYGITVPVRITDDTLATWTAWLGGLR
jgi:exodeoxyribonuclease V beta subunit